VLEEEVRLLPAKEQISLIPSTGMVVAAQPGGRMLKEGKGLTFMCW